mmetsp:Transcript_10772/g.29722  ORF Transcript_10772/g.29722 Transcript_10772/m.29722 type:complete len:88 (-) Transcript_10772:20-283(-)
MRSNDPPRSSLSTNLSLSPPKMKSSRMKKAGNSLRLRMTLTDGVIPVVLVCCFGRRQQQIIRGSWVACQVAAFRLFIYHHHDAMLQT